MKVAIHQPHYFPYPGFFHKAAHSDVLVVMDETQYDKRFTNRNRILDPHGVIWLTVPIEKADRFLSNREVRVNNRIPWRQDHWKKLCVSYANAEQFHHYAGELKELYETDWSSLLELDCVTTRKVMKWLGMTTSVVMESVLGVNSKGTQRLVDICHALGADTYLSGRGAGDYLKEDLFTKNGVRVEFQSYSPRAYPQRFTSQFIPDLSVLDLLVNVGPAAASFVQPLPAQAAE